jgi:parallel beta-helix repeat protein
MGVKRKRQTVEAAIAVGALLIFISGIQAATLEVDDSGGQPYTTIQSAINAASTGVDDVFVHCGVYDENITMRDGVTVRGAGPSCTIIDGGGSGSVVTIVDVGSATVLEGFTIRNGSSELGGGVFLETSALTIRGNVIEDNSAVDGGSTGAGQGGGIHITTDLSLRVFTEPVITGNVIRGNTADTYGGGIALYIDDGATIRNNLIEHNSAVLAGGGIHAFTSYPDVINNTIVRNCLQGGGTACSQGGGGIALTSSGIVDISNNVIAWNEAAAHGGGVDMVGSMAAFLSNDVFGNTPADYFGVTDPTGSDGNISTDPLFADEQSTMAGYQPRSDSPLVDGGTATLAPAVDIRAIPRPMDGDAGGTAEHDIGARENERPELGSFHRLVCRIQPLPRRAPGPQIYRRLYPGHLHGSGSISVVRSDKSLGERLGLAQLRLGSLVLPRRRERRFRRYPRFRQLTLRTVVHPGQSLPVNR